MRHVLNTIEAAFRVQPLLAQLPLYRETGSGNTSMCGVFDLVTMEALEWDAEADPHWPGLHYHPSRLRTAGATPPCAGSQRDRGP